MLQSKFRSFAQRFPRVASGAVLAEDVLRFNLSWPDFDKNRRRQVVATSSNLQGFTFAEHYDEFDLTKITGSTVGELPSQVLVQTFSPSNKRIARLSLIDAEPNAKDKSSILQVDVFDHLRGKIASVQVGQVHGSFVANEGIAWHPTERVFAYVADRVPSNKKQPFEHVEDWGEGYEGIAQPRIFLFDLETNTSRMAIEEEEEGGETSQFSPRFHPSTSAVALAYRSIAVQNHLKLGLLYCVQRPSAVHVAWFNRETLLLERDSLVSTQSSTADCPVFSSATKLVFLSSPPFETHGGPQQVSTCELDVYKRTVCPPRTLTQLNLFPSGPLALQSTYNNKLYMSVFQKARERMVSVDLETGHVAHVDGKEDDGDMSSSHLLAVSPRTGDLLFVRSDPGNTGTVVFGRKTVFQAPTLAVPIKYKVLDHKSGSNSILYLPAAKEGEKSPLVLVPHGGPHSAFTTQHMAEYAFTVQELGCAMLLVNYRGSLGFDDPTALESLLGRVGEQDVQDTMEAMQETLELYSQTLSSERVAVSGGSHGGFIAAHVSGQFPDRFRCAAMRNPVIDISTMYSTTDIPDWCKVEALGGKFHPQSDMLHLAQLQEMRRRSPIHHIANVTLPTLLCLGVKDRRVPYQSQGLFYYRMLKMRRIPHVKLLTFPQDGHPIDRPASAEALWAETVSFMQRHLLDDSEKHEESRFSGTHIVLRSKQ